MIMRTLFVLIVIVVLLGYAGVVKAEEQATSVSVGIKTWISTWTTSIDDTSIKSDSSVMAGPTLGIQSGKFFWGVTFLSGEFIFPSKTICPLLSCASNVAVDLKPKRKDVDIAVGYRFTPNVGAFIGHKKIDYKLTGTCSGSGCSVGTVDLGETTASGPVFGANLTLPMGQSRWFFVGNLSFLSLTTKSSGEADEKSDGSSAEINFIYVAEAMPISVSIGSKAQQFKDKDKDVDKFSGLTFGANYAF